MAKDRDRQLVAAIAAATTDAEKDAPSARAAQLLDIRASALSPLQKAKRAIALTTRAAVIWPMVKFLARELKAYSPRTLETRFRA